MYEGRRGRKFKKWGKRGPCSFCGKIHIKGKKRGDSCRGHKKHESRIEKEKRQHKM